MAIDKGVPIPEGWALDKNGNPTTNAHDAGLLLPFGGFKGANLAMMMECLSGVMAGNPLLEPTLREDREKKADFNGPGGPLSKHVQNSVVAAIDIATFTDVESYKENISNLIDGIKALPKADGFEEIFVPGEVEEKTYLERSKNGIPLPGGTWDKLRAMSERFAVKLPA